MIVRLAVPLLAASLLVVVPAAAASAEGRDRVPDPPSGCTATYPTNPTCEFTASGPISYAAAGAGAWRVDVWRGTMIVNSRGGNLSQADSMYAEPGDRVVATTSGTACAITVRNTS